MLHAPCIYLGLITPYPETFHPLHLPRRLIIPCPETFHPLHLPRRLITPCPTTNAISTKEYPKHPTSLTFPLSLPQASLQTWSLPDPSLHLAWSLGGLSLLLAWIKVTYFCWGHLSLFCLGLNYNLHIYLIAFHKSYITYAFIIFLLHTVILKTEC